jgi:hypothetical protein
MARDYVRFAWEERPPFETLYGAGLDKNRYPELKRAYEPIDAFPSFETEVCGGDATARDALATAHGHAALLADGSTAGDPTQSVPPPIGWSPPRVP